MLFEALVNGSLGNDPVKGSFSAVRSAMLAFGTSDDSPVADIFSSRPARLSIRNDFAFQAIPE